MGLLGGFRAKYVQELVSNPDKPSQSLERVQKFLGILESAADHLANQDLKTRLIEQATILEKMRDGKIRTEEFETALLAELAKMEQLAGPRRDVANRRIAGKKLCLIANSTRLRE